MWKAGSSYTGISRNSRLYLQTFIYRNGQKEEQDLEDYRFHVQYRYYHHVDCDTRSMGTSKKNIICRIP